MPIELTGHHDATLTYKELGSPEAVRLSELELLKGDLLESLSAFNLIALKYNKPNASKDERVIALSLMRSAYILWVGCFEKPKNGDLSADEIYGSIEGALLFFKSAKDVRDSYAAHRFGPQRHCTTIAILTNGVVTGIQNVTMKYLRPGADELAQAIRAIQIAIGAIDTQSETLRGEVIAQVQTLAPAEVAALPDLRHTAPSLEHVKMSRKAFRAIRDGGAPPPTRSGR